MTDPPRLSARIILPLPVCSTGQERKRWLQALFTRNRALEFKKKKKKKVVFHQGNSKCKVNRVHLIRGRGWKDKV